MCLRHLTRSSYFFIIVTPAVGMSQCWCSLLAISAQGDGNITMSVFGGANKQALGRFAVVIVSLEHLACKSMWEKLWKACKIRGYLEQVSDMSDG